MLPSVPTKPTISTPTLPNPTEPSVTHVISPLNTELDEDRDGEIPRKIIGKFLAKVGRDPKTCATQIASFCRGGFIVDTSGGKQGDGRTDHQHGQRQGRRGQTGFAAGDKGATGAETKSAQRSETNSRGGTEGRRQQQQRVSFADDYGDDGGLPVPSSSASLAEILAAFGFVFDGAGAAVKPSVAEAFAKLRLHAQPGEARAAGEAAKRCMAASKLNFFIVASNRSC